jgi:hypothetical protein
MKKWKWIILFVLAPLAPLPLMAQISNPSVVPVTAAPASCPGTLPIYIIAKGYTGAGTFYGNTSASTGTSCSALNNPSGGAGTVTSVTFTGDGTVLSSMPSSAVTTSGTLTATLAAQTANTLLGAISTTLSALAVPSCSASQNALEWTTGTGFSCVTIPGFANPMTTLGDIIYGGASGAPTRLAGNTSATTFVLTQTGTGSASAGPSWGTAIGTTGATIPLLNGANFWTGAQTITNSFAAPLKVSTSTSTTAAEPASFFSPSLSAGSYTYMPLGISLTTLQSAYWIFDYVGSANAGNFTEIALDGENGLNVYGNGGASVGEGLTSPTNPPTNGLIVAGGVTLPGLTNASTGNNVCYNSGVVEYSASPCASGGTASALSSPAGTATFVAGTSVTSCLAASGYPAPTNTRGDLTIIGGTATTGTICTVSFSTTLSAAPSCMVTQNGGASLFGIGWGAPSTTSFTITAGITVAASTLNVHYQCQP